MAIKPSNSLDAYEAQVRKSRLGYGFLTWCIAWFFFYVVATGIDETFANLSSVLYILGLFVTSVWCIKYSSYRISWSFLAAMLFFWAIGDSVWFYLSVMGIEPIGLIWLENIYTFSNLAMFSSVVSFFLINRKRWNTIQLSLDVMVVTVILAIIILRIYFPQMNAQNLFHEEFWTVSVVLISNISTVLLIVALVASSRSGDFLKNMILVVLGITLYIAIDMWYVYKYINATYQANSLIDILYYIGFFPIVLGGVLNSLKPNPRTPFRSVDSTKQKTTRVVWAFTLIPIVLTLTGYLNPLDLTVCIVSVIIYYFSSHYYQKSVLIESLLENERLLNLHLEGIVADRTRDLVEANRVLERKATTDSLTGLANRDNFMQCIRDEIDECKNGKGVFSLIHIDIDRFNVVNDIHGHFMGDQVLLAISRVLKVTLASTYNYKQYLLARIGGDEFGVLLRLNNPDLLKDCGIRLIEAIKKPVAIEHYQFYFGATIGMACYPMDGNTAENMIKSTSIAMNQAKGFNNKAKMALYSDDIFRAIARRNHIEWLLHKVHFNRDFQLYYQPQFSTQNCRLVGMEALLRWRHPDEGFISPGEFIPIAEAIGMIPELSTWTFNAAMEQMAKWLKTFPEVFEETNGKKNIRMGINVSALLFDCVDFLPALENACKSHSIAPEWFDLEITETGAMNASDHVEGIFAYLSKVGFTISIDDFGTGYSSLSYLKRFSVHSVKIAKELIDTVEYQHHDQLIIQAIIAISQGMSLKTIAEGVETEAQFELLKKLGCDEIQGYYLGKPCSAETFEAQYLLKGGIYV